MSSVEGNTVVYFHRGCADGRVAAALLAAHLGPDARVQSASASMSGFEYPPAGTDTAFFVDLCPTEDMLPRLAQCAREVVILDHHLSSRDLCARLAGRPGFRVHHHMDLCGAQVVDTHYPRAAHPRAAHPRAAGPAHARVSAAIAAVATYDLWLDPSDDVFRFKAGVDLLWARATVDGAPTTAAQCRAFLAALAETPHAEVVALGAPALAAVEAEYRACTPFPARFAPAAGWDGGARALAVRAQSNASILGHWLLRDYPEEVAVLLWPARDGVQRASLRSRTLCIPDALPWARGHAHACAGRLPADVAERLRRDSI